MAKKSKAATETEVIVTDKDYLREVPSDFSNKILSDDSSPLLILYESSSCNMDYYIRNLFPENESLTYFVHGCDAGNGKPQKMVYSGSGYRYNLKCKYCGKEISSYSTFSTDENYKLGTTRYGCGRTKMKSSDVIYVAQKEDEPDTTIMRLMEVGYDYTKEDEGVYKILPMANVKTALEIIPGVSIKGYKTLKRSIKEMPAFEAMNINTQTINSEWTRKFVFEDSVNLMDYLTKHKIFAERTGIHAALKTFPANTMSIRSAPFMLLHMCMISEYPVLELLIKMGYSKLYYDLINTFFRAQSKIEILERVKKYQALFTKSTKGAAGLRIPNYIGDYLKEKAAPLSEYMIWCNIYELQPLSKEQFAKYIDSIEFISINLDNALNIMPNIIKYDYTIEQATKYIHKQRIMANKKGSRNDANWFARTMHDYLTMCEYMELTPNKFPSDIAQAHDEISRLRSTSKRTDYSKMISIGKSTQTLLDSFINPKDLTKMEKDYFIKVPVSEADFIEEGNLQNSCVGHYAKKVNAEERIVFFVRKQDEPNKSFITAEYVCATGTLGQCMYANNREVEDEDLISYCKVACGRIKTGLLTGKIA